MNRKKKRSASRFTLIAMSLLVTFLLSACTAPASSPLKGGGSGTVSVPVSLNVALKHSPTGTATLAWDATNQTLQVNVAVSGLAPNSTHPMHIHAGNCANSANATMVFALNSLQADAHGVGSSRTSIAGVTGGIPAQGWFLNIHNGPTLADALQARSIACADIANTHSSGTANQTIQLALHSTTVPDEAVQGSASIQLTQNGVVVKVVVHGLVPGTTHMAHIHSGTCASQGGVLFALQTVTADQAGNGTSTTTIRSIKTLPLTALYINVHEAGTMNGMSVQQGFNPISCGDIVLPS